MNVSRKPEPSFVRREASSRIGAPLMWATSLIAAGGFIMRAECGKRVQINRSLGQYRWHGSNTTSAYAPAIQSLVLDEARKSFIKE